MVSFNLLRPLKKRWPLNVLQPPKVTGTFQQEVLHKNEDIYHRIAQALRGARSQVLVATAWFTDRNLFDILSDLLRSGIEVRLIIGDLTDNEKLPFDSLADQGAAVRRIRRSGSGSMNQKFCVVDGHLAIHGSYNWTNNARNGNQESVIVTTLEDTVHSLIRQFQEMEMEQEAEADLPTRKASPTATGQAAAPSGSTATEPPPAAPDAFKTSYAEVLDRMIAAEVTQFDRDLLRTQGYERAEACNADPQMLGSAMDTVYSVFINDINVIEDKKKRLIGKIQEQKVVHGAVLESRFQKSLQAIASEAESEERGAAIRIANLKAAATVCELELAALKDERLASTERTGREIEARIREMEQESLVPRFKWYEFIPVTLFCLALLCYLVLFYSSAVYILLFSTDGARNAQMTGGAWQTPQVFEPRAFSYVLKEGRYAVGFVCLFVCIPLSLSLAGRLSKDSWLGKKWAMMTFTVLLDAGIAYKVAAAVHESNYLVGNTREAWNPSMAFLDSNFYLVFLLGSLGLLLFSALFHRFFFLLEERNPDVGLLQLRLRRSQESALLTQNQDQVALLKEGMDILRKEQVRLRKESHLQELEQAAIARQTAQRQARASLELENDKKTLETITAIYTAHIENDIMPISLDSMKDRINVFLEGWTDFVNDEYAVVKAIEKSKQAVSVAAAWQQERLVSHRIDNRIKAV